MDEGTKTDSGDRRVKILKPAMTVLLEQKQHTYIANDAIFHNPRTGERWRGADPIWDRWKRTLQLAKVKYRNPYQTRHTYASMMLTAGESDRWVAAQMGHSDVGMINQIYGKWIADAKPDANKAVAHVLCGSGPSRRPVLAGSMQKSWQKAGKHCPIHASLCLFHASLNF